MKAGDFFDELKEFEEAKGLRTAWELTQRFRRALSGKAFCSSLRALPEADFNQFQRRLEEVFDRLDSVGFICTLMVSELGSYKAFMARAYSPRGSHLRIPWDTDFVSRVQDARTLRFGLEAFLFFVDALLEYLSQGIGLVFKRPHDRQVSALVDALKQFAHNPDADRVVAALERHRPLWSEIQDGFRKKLINVDVGSNAHQHATLRDIAAHYRALRLSGLQMTVNREGRVLTNETLEPGATSYEKPGEFRGWGEGKGITTDCEAIRDELQQMLTGLLDVLVVDPQPRV